MREKYGWWWAALLLLVGSVLNGEAMVYFFGVWGILTSIPGGAVLGVLGWHWFIKPHLDWKDSHRAN